MKKLNLLPVVLIGVMFFTSSCLKTNVSPDASGAYVPTATDVTSKATLVQLQQGHDLFVNNCQSCHGLPVVSSTTAAYLPSMASRAGLSASQTTLINLYLTHGK